MKRHIPTFEEFVAENYDAEGFNPQKEADTDALMAPIKSAADLVPGKEYQVSVDGDTMSDMIYQGQSGGEYVFNEMDHNEEPVRFSEDAMMNIIDAEGVRCVMDDKDPSAPNLKID